MSKEQRSKYYPPKELQIRMGPKEVTTDQLREDADKQLFIKSLNPEAKAKYQEFEQKVGDFNSNYAKGKRNFSQIRIRAAKLKDIEEKAKWFSDNGYKHSFAIDKETLCINAYLGPREPITFRPITETTEPSRNAPNFSELLPPTSSNPPLLFSQATLAEEEPAPKTEREAEADLETRQQYNLEGIRNLKI